MDLVEVRCQLKHKTVVELKARIGPYYAKFNDIVARIHPALAQQCNAALAKIDDFAARPIFIEREQGNVIKSSYAFFAKYDELRNDIEPLITVFNDQSILRTLLIGMSNTYVAEIQQEHARIQSVIDKLYDTDELDFINEIVYNHISIKNSLTEILNFVSVTIAPNKFLTELIRATIPYAQDDAKKAFIKIVEAQKDAVLESRRHKLQYRSSQNIMVRCGLYPKSLSMPLKELLEMIGINTTDEAITINSLGNIAPEYGFIVINNTIGTPIEYDIRGLVSTQYLLENNLKMSPQAGLNKKILQRFATIKELAGQISLTETPSAISTEATILLPDIVAFNSAKASKIIVLESLTNGLTYRVLAADEQSWWISREQAVPFFEGITLRPLKYNKLHESIILNQCFDERSQIILTQYKDNMYNTLPTEGIVNNLQHDFEKAFEDQLRILPSSADEFYRLVMNKMSINKIILSRLMIIFKTAEKKSAEYTLTHIAKFDAIARQFIRELEGFYKVGNITDQIFSERKDVALRSHLQAVYADMIRKSIAELDRMKQWSEFELTTKEFMIERHYGLEKK